MGRQKPRSPGHTTFGDYSRWVIQVNPRATGVGVLGKKHKNDFMSLGRQSFLRQKTKKQQPRKKKDTVTLDFGKNKSFWSSKDITKELKKTRAVPGENNSPFMNRPMDLYPE